MSVAIEDYIIQAGAALILFLLTIRIVKLVSSVTTTLVQLAVLLLAALLVIQFALQRGANEAWSSAFATVSSFWTTITDLFANSPSVFTLLQWTKDWLLGLPAVGIFFKPLTPPPPPPSSFVPEWIESMRRWQ